MVKGRGPGKGGAGVVGAALGAVRGSGPQRKRARTEAVGGGLNKFGGGVDRQKKDQCRGKGHGGGERREYDREYQALLARTRGKQQASEFHRREQMRAKVVTPTIAAPSFINLPQAPTVSEFVESMLGDDMLQQGGPPRTAANGGPPGQLSTTPSPRPLANNAFAALHMDSGDEEEEQEPEKTGGPVMQPATFVPVKRVGPKGMEKRKRAMLDPDSSDEEDEGDKEKEEEDDEEGQKEEGEQQGGGQAAHMNAPAPPPPVFAPPVFFAPPSFVPPSQAGIVVGGQGVGQVGTSAAAEGRGEEEDDEFADL